MALVTVYGLNNCDSCRKARKWLDADGTEYRFVDYRDQPVAPATLAAWAGALGGWDTLVNRRSSSWRQLSDAEKQADSEAKWLALIARHPTLVKRPVLVVDEAVRVGFDAAAWPAMLRGDA